MNLSNIYEGMIIKNYGKLCRILEIDEKKGNSKKYQIKELRRYFQYSKNGQSITIDHIYESPTEKVVFKRQRKPKPEKIKTARRNNAGFNALYCVYRTQAAKRNLAFELSKDEFKEITKKNCFYCGKVPTQLMKTKNGEYLYNGIDRIDNSKGYITENVVPCCGKCNKAKSNDTLENFLAWAERVYNNMGGRTING